MVGTVKGMIFLILLIELRVLSQRGHKTFLFMGSIIPRKEHMKSLVYEQETYDSIRALHLDSLELYRKYTYEERPTYRLDAIGEMEVGEKKTVYEGTLDPIIQQRL